MAIVRVIQFNGDYIGDGVATSFTINVKDFPVNPNSNDYIDFNKTPTPIGVSNNGNPAYTVSITGTVITVTFAVAPIAGQVGNYVAYLEF